jgi:hypothetical protein
VAWLPSSLLTLLIFLSTPIRSKQAASRLPLIFTEKTRAARNYSQGNRGTQGKIAKKAEKMRVFWGRVEITAENAVLGLRAGHSNELSNAPTGLTDAAMGEFAKAGGLRMVRLRAPQVLRPYHENALRE